MSTQEDREHDEREEYGWGNPLDGGLMRLSAILADRFGPLGCEHEDWIHDREWRECLDCGERVRPQPVDEVVDSGYTPADLQREKSLDRAQEFLDESSENTWSNPI